MFCTQPEQIFLACRLQYAEAKLLISIFEDFWADSHIKEAVIRIAAQVSNSSAYDGVARTPAHSNTAAKEERSRANAKRTAADGQDRKAAARGPAQRPLIRESQPVPVKSQQTAALVQNSR